MQDPDDRAYGDTRMSDDDVLGSNGDPHAQDDAHAPGLDDRRWHDAADSGDRAVADGAVGDDGHDVDGEQGEQYTADAGDRDDSDGGDVPDDPDGRDPGGASWVDPDVVVGAGAWWDDTDGLTPDDSAVMRLGDDPSWPREGHDTVVAYFGGSSAADLLGGGEETWFDQASSAVEALRDAWSDEAARFDLDPVDGFATPDALGDDE